MSLRRNRLLLGAKKLPAANRQLLMKFRFNRVGSVLIVRRVQEVLTDAEHVAGAHGQDNVAGRAMRRSSASISANVG